MSNAKTDYTREAARVNLRKMLEGKSYGSLISAAEVIEATGFAEWTAFRALVQRWAKNMGLPIFSVTGDGWRIGMPNESVNYSERKRKQAVRADERGLGVLLKTPAEQLSERESRRHTFALDRTAVRVSIARQDDVDTKRIIKGESAEAKKVARGAFRTEATQPTISVD